MGWFSCGPDKTLRNIESEKEEIIAKRIEACQETHLNDLNKQEHQKSTGSKLTKRNFTGSSFKLKLDKAITKRQSRLY